MIVKIITSLLMIFVCNIYGDSVNDVMLSLPEGRPWLLSQRMAVAENSEIEFYPGCYDGDGVTHVVDVNVVIDVGVASRLIGNHRDNIATLLSKGQEVFLSQLNLYLRLNRVISGSINDPTPLSRGGETCLGALSTMSEFMRWLSVVNSTEAAYWLFLSDCFSSGVNGVSYIGSACGKRGNNGGVASYSWLTAIHEIGHGFGMTHSFEDGVGLTGGIMDYGSGKFNGTVQIHPSKKAEICPFLQYIQQSSCIRPLMTNGTSCGNGIVEDGEQCECLTVGSSSCAGCVSCQLLDPSTECSVGNFVIRGVVSESGLASPYCCVSGRLVRPKTLCGEKRLDACGAGGKCVQLCTKDLLSDNPNCGFDGDGCKLGCVWKGRCRFDMTTEDRFISDLPDGTKCGDSGQCINGTCQFPYTMVPTTTPLPPQKCYRHVRRSTCNRMSRCQWKHKKCRPKL